MRWFVVFLSLTFALDASAKKDPGYLAVYDQITATPSAPKALAAPESAEPLPWAVGQWVVLKETDAAGAVSYRRTSIVAHDAEDCGWWVESVTTTGSPTEGSILKVCYSVPPWPRPETTEPIVVVVKAKVDLEKTVTIDLRTEEGQQIVDRMGRYFVGAFQPLTYDDATAPMAITVASGTYDGCRKVEAEARAMAETMKGSGWVHSSVPVFGLVQAEAGGSVTELVDFGLTGAVSILK